jgi:hypothetical protein
MGIKITKYDDGVWNVTTENSSYVLDLDKYLFAKLQPNSPTTVDKLEVYEWFKLIDMHALMGGTLNVAIQPLNSDKVLELMSSNIVSINKLS